MWDRIEPSCLPQVLHRLFPPIPVHHFILLFVGIAFTLAAHTLALPRPDPRDALSPQKASDAFRLRGGLCLVLYLATIGGCSELPFGGALDDACEALSVSTRLFLMTIVIATCITVALTNSRDRRSEEEKIGSLPTLKKVERSRAESEESRLRVRGLLRSRPESPWHPGLAWTAIALLVLLQLGLGWIVGEASGFRLSITLSVAVLAALACGAFLYFHHFATGLNGSREGFDRLLLLFLNLMKFCLPVTFLAGSRALPILRSTGCLRALRRSPPRARARAGADARGARPGAGGARAVPAHHEPGGAAGRGAAAPREAGVPGPGRAPAPTV